MPMHRATRNPPACHPPPHLLRVRPVLGEHHLQRLAHRVADHRAVVLADVAARHRQHPARLHPRCASTARQRGALRPGHRPRSACRRARRGGTTAAGVQTAILCRRGGECGERRDEALQPRDVEARRVAVQQLPQRGAHARVVVGEQATRQVRHALCHNGIAWVDAQRGALDDRERTDDVGEVARDAHLEVHADARQLRAERREVQAGVAEAAAAGDLGEDVRHHGLDARARLGGHVGRHELCV
eukprot:51584-Chlamydomonas_euryale.AAC.1